MARRCLGSRVLVLTLVRAVTLAAGPILAAAKIENPLIE